MRLQNIIWDESSPVETGFRCFESVLPNSLLLSPLGLSLLLSPPDLSVNSVWVSPPDSSSCLSWSVFVPAMMVLARARMDGLTGMEGTKREVSSWTYEWVTDASPFIEKYLAERAPFERSQSLPVIETCTGKVYNSPWNYCYFVFASPCYPSIYSTVMT